MKNNVITGRTFADLIFFIITQKKTYIILASALVVSYGIVPDIGNKINQTIAASITKMTHIEDTVEEPRITIKPDVTHVQLVLENRQPYYTIQIFISRYQDAATKIATQLWTPTYQARMEKIQGKYYVFIGKYSTEIGAKSELDKFLNKGFRGSSTVLESKPFVKFIEYQKIHEDLALTQ